MWLNHPNLFSPKYHMLCRLKRKVKVGSYSTTQTCSKFCFYFDVGSSIHKTLPTREISSYKKSGLFFPYGARLLFTWRFTWRCFLPNLHSGDHLWEWHSSLSKLVMALLRAQVPLIWRVEERDGILGNKPEEFLPLHVSSSYGFHIYIYPPPPHGILMWLRSGVTINYFLILTPPKCV